MTTRIGKKILVFGTFDGIHLGHLSFLKQARRLGNQLVVAIARDKTVWKLKKKKPVANEQKRLELAQSLKIVDQAMIGDREISSYKIVKKLKPDMICLGYDQKKLAADIKKRLPDVKIVVAKAYKSKKMHTSKLTVNN